MQVPTEHTQLMDMEQINNNWRVTYIMWHKYIILSVTTNVYVLLHKNEISSIIAHSVTHRWWILVSFIYPNPRLSNLIVCLP